MCSRLEGVSRCEENTKGRENGVDVVLHVPLHDDLVAV